MQINIKTLIIPSILLFLLLTTKFSITVAGVILLVILAGISFKIFVKKTKRKYLALNGIKSVPKELVFNSNTLTNNYCIVRYFQNEKIIVMDNPLSKENKTLRAFVVDKTNHENITDCWNDVCSVYDEYTSLDALHSFIDKASKRLGVMYFNHSVGEFTLEGMEEFLPKSEIKTPQLNITNEKLVEKIEQTALKGPIVVEFEDFKVKNIQPRVKSENINDLVNMQDLTDRNKIDVNLANSQVISEYYQDSHLELDESERLSDN